MINQDATINESPSRDAQLQSQRDSLARQRQEWNAYERRRTEELDHHAEYLQHDRTTFVQQKNQELGQLKSQREDLVRQRQLNDDHSARRISQVNDLLGELQELIRKAEGASSQNTPNGTN